MSSWKTSIDFIPVRPPCPLIASRLVRELGHARDTKHFPQPQTCAPTAGAVAGTVAAIITLPLERIKTIYQSSMKGAAVRSVRATVSHILATEGASGLVRGLVPTIAGVAPARAVYFGTYANVKSALTSSGDDAPGPASHLISAATAGFTTATVIAPVFMVKTRMQLLGGLTGAVPSSTPSTTPHRLLDTVRGIYREGGLRAFYRVRAAPLRSPRLVSPTRPPALRRASRHHTWACLRQSSSSWCTSRSSAGRLHGQLTRLQRTRGGRRHRAKTAPRPVFPCWTPSPPAHVPSSSHLAPPTPTRWCALAFGSTTIQPQPTPEAWWAGCATSRALKAWQGCTAAWASTSSAPCPMPPCCS